MTCISKVSTRREGSCTSGINGNVALLSKKNNQKMMGEVNKKVSQQKNVSISNIQEVGEINNLKYKIKKMYIKLKFRHDLKERNVETSFIKAVRDSKCLGEHEI